MLKSECSFDNPFGVAVDSCDGCVYVTDNTSRNSRIIKLSPDFKFKKILTSNLLQYRSLSIVGDEVIVCCIEEIMVYTKELEYVRTIGYNGDGVGQLFEDIRDVSSDEQGNLYVSDFSKSCVQVFSNSGEFLHSLDCGGDGVKKLNGPFGVCVFSQYVYVTNWHSHCVSVFTTDGDHMTTFGHLDGVFMHPCGVCVDKDGFVYVCDLANSMLQIF